MDSDVGYCFFWRPSQAHGWASQWFPSPFTDPDLRQVPEFPTAEHYMMYRKAMLFSDPETAQAIVDSKATGNEDLTRIKKLGRQVKNFDPDVWQENRWAIVLRGNRLKFTDPSLDNKLLRTDNKTLVEASPYDKIWGIGYEEKDALRNKHSWGENILGKILMEVRHERRAEHQKILLEGNHNYNQ